MLDIKKLFAHKEHSEMTNSVDIANEHDDAQLSEVELSDKEIECCGMATD